MVLLAHHDELLLSLAAYGILTEHELAHAVAKKLKQKEVDVIPKIGPWLLELKAGRLVWAGQLFSERQFMWCAALTELGKQMAQAI